MFYACSNNRCKLLQVATKESISIIFYTKRNSKLSFDWILKSQLNVYWIYSNVTHIHFDTQIFHLVTQSFWWHNVLLFFLLNLPVCEWCRNDMWPCCIEKVKWWQTYEEEAVGRKSKWTIASTWKDIIRLKTTPYVRVSCRVFCIAVILFPKERLKFWIQHQHTRRRQRHNQTPTMYRMRKLIFRVWLLHIIHIEYVRQRTSSEILNNNNNRKNLIKTFGSSGIYNTGNFYSAFLSHRYLNTFYTQINFFRCKISNSIYNQAKHSDDEKKTMMVMVFILMMRNRMAMGESNMFYSMRGPAKKCWACVS